MYISYYDYINDDLKYATNATDTWITEAVDSSGDVGQYTSIVVDTTRRIHISYYDYINGDLKYATAVLPGRIYGLVADKQGNPLQDVGVKLEGKRTKIKKETTSDSSGYFAFEGLEKDTYKITTKKKGYRKSKQRVELEEGEEGEVEIMMKKKKKRAARTKYFIPTNLLQSFRGIAKDAYPFFIFPVTV